MKKKYRSGALVVAVTLASFAFRAEAQDVKAVQSPQTGAASFIAAGSGVNLGITQLLAEAFTATHPGVEIKVPGSIGTKGAITAVKDGGITLGLISRDLKDEEKSPELISLPYGRTPYVIGAHAAVADDGITSQELAAIYKGTKTKWKDGHEIIVQSREAFDSGFGILEKKIPGFKDAIDESRKDKRWALSFTDQEANHAIENVRYAIGGTDLGMIHTEKLSIKPLKLDGVAPSIENVQNGKYPLSRTLYVLYREKTLPAEARAFLDFVKSDAGAKILRDNGYEPLAK